MPESTYCQPRMSKKDNLFYTCNSLWDRVWLRPCDKCCGWAFFNHLQCFWPQFSVDSEPNLIQFPSPNGYAAFCGVGEVIEASLKVREHLLAYPQGFITTASAAESWIGLDLQTLVSVLTFSVASQNNGVVSAQLEILDLKLNCSSGWGPQQLLFHWETKRYIFMLYTLSGR